jgi:hypothetical protein
MLALQIKAREQVLAQIMTARQTKWPGRARPFATE